MQTATAEYFDDSELLIGMTRRERKLNNKKKKMQSQPQQPKSYDLKHVEPKTDNQHKVFKAFFEDKNLLLHGLPGTGKTFLALYLSLDSVINNDAPKPIVILRSVVPTREMGFLPGKIEEKSAPYEAPYVSICAELTGHATAYDHFKKNNIIQFSTTSHLRGLTFRNNTIIVDECQNMTGKELSTIITRVGEGCRVIFCGDFRQSDIKEIDFINFMKILKNMRSFEHIEFGTNDIVRSGIVREFIITQTNLNIQF